MQRLIFFLFLSITCFTYAPAQDLHKIDSLYQLANQLPTDTSKIDLYRQIIYEYTISNKYLKKAELITDTLCQMANQLNSVVGKAACLDIRGTNARHKGQNIEALALHEEALKTIQTIDHPYDQAYILNNIGFVYSRMDEYQTAIAYHLQAQKIAETHNHLRNLSNSIVSIGNCYRRMKRHETALSYFHRGLALERKQGVPLGISINMNNIGILYVSLHQYDSAEYYINHSLELSYKIKNHKGVAISYGHLGGIAMARKDMRKALAYYLKALSLDEELGDKRYISESNLLVGNLYLEIGNYDLAQQYLAKGLVMAQELRSRNKIQTAYEKLARVAAHLKNYPQAYEYAQLAILYKDSVLNEENQRNIAQQEARFKSESKEAKIRMLEKDQLHKTATIHQQQKIFFAMGIAIVLFVILVFVLIYNNRQKHFINQLLTEQKTEIEQQRNNIAEQHQVLEIKNQEIAKKNLDITASINYAQRIQAAMLPSTESIAQLFNEFFILYQPRDIVSGDFYWACEVQQAAQNYAIMIVADCVGHGVPGAFMSMIGNNTLNNVVKEDLVVEPAKILASVNMQVMKALQQQQSKSRDSIDMIVLCYAMGTRTVEFAGAMNPLYYIQNGELQTLKGDNFNIGGYFNENNDKKFTNHRIVLTESPTVFYLTTDGYQDQFGGKSNKKFMTKRLKELFVQLHTLPMPQQAYTLTTTLNHWLIEGNESQTDDITIVGIRL